MKRYFFVLHRGILERKSGQTTASSLLGNKISLTFQAKQHESKKLKLSKKDEVQY